MTNIDNSVKSIYLPPLVILFLSFYARWTKRSFTRVPFALFWGVLDKTSNRPWKLEPSSWNRRSFETARVSMQYIGDYSRESYQTHWLFHRIGPCCNHCIKPDEISPYKRRWNCSIKFLCERAISERRGSSCVDFAKRSKRLGIEKTRPLDVYPFDGRHDELVSDGGVYANMWLQQQKAEMKEKEGGTTDSGEESRDE